MQQSQNSKFKFLLKDESFENSKLDLNEFDQNVKQENKKKIGLQDRIIDLHISDEDEEEEEDQNQQKNNLNILAELNLKHEKVASFQKDYQQKLDDRVLAKLEQNPNQEIFKLVAEENFKLLQNHVQDNYLLQMIKNIKGNMETKSYMRIYYKKSDIALIKEKSNIYQRIVNEKNRNIQKLKSFLENVKTDEDIEQVLASQYQRQMGVEDQEDEEQSPFQRQEINEQFIQKFDKDFHAQIKQIDKEQYMKYIKLIEQYKQQLDDYQIEMRKIEEQKRKIDLDKQQKLLESEEEFQQFHNQLKIWNL